MAKKWSLRFERSESIWRGSNDKVGGYFGALYLEKQAWKSPYMATRIQAITMTELLFTLTKRICEWISKELLDCASLSSFQARFNAYYDLFAGIYQPQWVLDFWLDFDCPRELIYLLWSNPFGGMNLLRRMPTKLKTDIVLSVRKAMNFKNTNTLAEIQAMSANASLRNAVIAAFASE